MQQCIENSLLKTVYWNPPLPPIRALAGDCGEFHLIYTSFWFPSRRGIRLKSPSSHLLPGQVIDFRSINETTSTIKIFDTLLVYWGAFASYLLAAQRSICLFHGCQQCLLTGIWRAPAFNQCVTRSNNKLFHKGSTMSVSYTHLTLPTKLEV